MLAIVTAPHELQECEQPGQSAFARILDEKYRKSLLLRRQQYSSFSMRGPSKENL